MHQAKALGLAAVGVADRNTLAGMVRALMGAEAVDIPLVVGSRLGFTDGTELIVFPRDRAAYGRLCRLLSLGKSEAFSVSSPSRSDGEGDHPEPQAKDGGGVEARPLRHGAYSRRAHRRDRIRSRDTPACGWGGDKDRESRDAADLRTGRGSG